MLRIEGFTLQGSEGSGNFGRPVPVETARSVKALMSQLEIELHNGGLFQAKSLELSSQVRSQASKPTDDAFSQGDFSQTGFSTQAPTKAPNGTTFGRHGDSTASNQALLALLKRTKGQQASTRDPEPAKNSESPYPEKPYENDVNGGSDSASPSTSSQHTTIPSTSTIQPTEPLAGSTNKRGHLPGNALLMQATSKSDISRSQRAERVEDGSINGGLLSQEISTYDGIENSTKVREDGNMSLRYISAVKPRHTPNNISQPAQDADNPWEGLIRIPRRYVQIPKEQRAILERDDAWYPQTPGRTKHDVNLPHNILLDLEAFHDRLGDTMDNGQTDSDGDSYSGHSKNKKDRTVKDSTYMKKAVCESVGSESPPSSRAVSSGRHNATVYKASLEPFSSDQDDSYVEGRLNAAEIDSGYKMAVMNTRESHIQVDKILPSGQTWLDKQVDVSGTSLDHRDGSSVDDSISWSPSPDRVEVHPSQNQFLHEEPPRFANEDRINRPNSIQSQASPNKISLVALRDAESVSSKEDDADSEAESFPVLQNQAEHLPTKATGRMTQYSKMGLKSSSAMFSSSPVEMELSVPDALGNQTLPPDDIVMTDVFDRGQPMSPTREQSPSRFDLERTPHAFSGSRSLGAKSHNMKSDDNKELRQQRACISSDPIIPGTFRSETSNTFSHPRELVSETHQTGHEGNNFEVDQVISATPGRLTLLHSCVLSPADGTKCLAQRQKPAESETPTEKSPKITSGETTALSVGNARKAVVGRQQFRKTNYIEIPTSPTIYEPSQHSIPGSQVSSPKSLLPPPKAPIEFETVLPNLTTPILRRVSMIGDMTEPSPKRRRTLQAVIFDSAPEKDTVIDPTEMAKANRRKFLKELSLQTSSPIHGSHKPLGDSTVRIHMASDAVAETSFENRLVSDSVWAWGDNVSPTGPPHGKPETAFAHLESPSAEKLQDKSLDHSVQDLDATNEDGSKGKRNDNGNLRRESTGPHQGKITVTKVKSSDSHPLHTDTIFDIFNKTYPRYNKSLRSFVRACVCLEWLHSMKKAPHPSLWDDFIRAFSAEYLDHVQECKLSKRKPMSAPEFYNSHVPEPVFMGRIMTLATLHEAFLLEPEETARGRAKTQSDKHRDSQESTTSSQITITSRSLAERQDTPTAFLTNSSSAQQLPSPATITSSESPDHHGNVEVVSSHVLGVVSAPDCMAVVKKPFFETPSQLITQARHNKSLKLSTSILAKEARNDEVLGVPTQHFESHDINKVQPNEVRQTSRRLPWSSPPQEKITPAKFIDVVGAIPGCSDARSRIQSSRQPSLGSSPRQREESPILGCAEHRALKADISPALLSNLDFRQDPIFKTPHLPASRSLGRRTTSMPGRRAERPDSLQMAKVQKQIMSPSTATFKDFSKAFVPRKKRRSSVFGQVSTPSSDASSSRIVVSNTLASKPQVEPDTQVWKF